MDYLYRILIWFFLSLIWGLIGVAAGPGIIMLFVGVTVGFSGSLLTCLSSSSTSVSGLMVFILSFILTLLLFQKSSLQGMEYLYLALFISIPSYLIIYIQNKFRL
jgi:hypothetical protein